jgi:D-amino-acid dehydrogenase
MTKNVLIIGAGITGVTSAYFLAKKGFNVTVVEKESYPAMMTSYANGGQLSVSNSETWTTWSNVLKASKWLFNKSAPLLVRPTPSIAKISWLLDFLWQTATNTYEENTKKTISLGLRARELYFDIADKTSINFDLKQNGILHFYKDQKYFQSAINATKNLYVPSGVNRHIITHDDVVQIEPMLLYSKGIVGGTYTEDDAMGDIHKFSNELAQYCESKLAVKFLFNTSIKSAETAFGLHDIEFSNGQMQDFDFVLICAGADSSSVAKLFHDYIDVYPVKGYSVTIKDNVNVFPQVSLLDDQAKIVTSTLGDRLRVAGTAELDDWNLDIRKDRITPLLNWVKTNFPMIDTRDYKPWAGLRPMTGSMIPIVRPGRLKGVYYNTGHGHLGWTLAPATANIIADVIYEDAK